MHSSLTCVLSTLAIALPVFSTLSPTPYDRTLKPIAIRNYEAAAGLQRRDDSEDFSDLSLRTQSQLIYGSPGDNGQLLLANMTLYAPDGLEMIMMERFEGLTSAVDCQGDDGTMSLTFSSQQAFDFALKEWEHINDSDDGKFLLIANHKGCGPDDERQPYLISKITENSASLTTYLTAQPAPWSDIAETYDLDFGHVTPYKHTTQIKERGFGDDVMGDFDESKSVTFDVSAGTKGQVSNIYSDDKFNLDCINCFTTGSFAIAGHISTHHWSLKELTITATPQDFQAELELEAKITASDSPANLQYEKNLLSFPIPGAGISIPHIFTLGATLGYDVGITTSFQGTATVDFGVSAGVPNTAQLTADLMNPDSSTATGFGGGSVTPLFDVKDMSASVTLGAYSKPKLSFGIEIIKIGTLDVDIGVKLPEIDVTLTAEYDQGGVCAGNPTTTGIKLNSTLNIEVDLDITAKLGSSDTPSYSKPVFTTTEPIASQCFALNIPGLQPSQTAIPTFLTTSSQSQISAAPSHIYSASGAGVVPIVNGTIYIIAPSGVSVPYSATVASGMPSMTGTGYIVGPSGTAACGTGGIPASSGNPLYPYSTSSSGIAAATGTGSAPVPSGVVSASGFSTLKVSPSNPPTGTAPSSSPVSRASSASSGLAPSGTGVSLRRSLPLLNSPPIKRASRTADDCTMVKRFGKRVLVC